MGRKKGMEWAFLKGFKRFKEPQLSQDFTFSKTLQLVANNNSAGSFLTTTYPLNGNLSARNKLSQD